MLRSDGGDAADRAANLASLFYPDITLLANFASEDAADIPEGPRTLLAHASHMTLAMEKFHGGPVTLTVVKRRECDDGRYAREILLKSKNGSVVQHGIVRIDLRCVPEDTAAAIRAEALPLGRILTSAGLHCSVHDVELLSIQPGPDFRSIVGASGVSPTFGRVATIGVDGRPLIELLEIVAPGTA